MRAVVTGENRGIGLELARQHHARGYTIEAAVRSVDRASELRAIDATAPGRLNIHACDVSDHASVRDFAAKLGSAAVDLLINNAGTYGQRDSLGQIDYAGMLRVFQV